MVSGYIWYRLLLCLLLLLVCLLLLVTSSITVNIIIDTTASVTSINTITSLIITITNVDDGLRIHMIQVFDNYVPYLCASSLRLIFAPYLLVLICCALSLRLKLLGCGDAQGIHVFGCLSSAASKMTPNDSINWDTAGGNYSA